MARRDLGSLHTVQVCGLPGIIGRIAMICLRTQQHARGDDIHIFLHEEEQSAAEHAAEELGGEAPVEASKALRFDDVGAETKHIQAGHFL